MDFETGRPDHIEDYLMKLHSGQWFGWSDSKNKIYANLILNSKFGNKEFKNLSFLNNFNKVKDILNNMTDSTRKNNLASILVGLKATNNNSSIL